PDPAEDAHTEDAASQSPKANPPAERLPKEKSAKLVTAMADTTKTLLNGTHAIAGVSEGVLVQPSPPAIRTEPQRQAPETDEEHRQVADGDEDEETEIPSERRTRPLTLAEAARLMGYRGDTKAKQRQLRTAMDAGSVRYKRLTRQRYVFDRND